MLTRLFRYSAFGVGCSGMLFGMALDHFPLTLIGGCTVLAVIVAELWGHW